MVNEKSVDDGPTIPVETPADLRRLEAILDTKEEVIALVHPTWIPLRRELDNTIYAYRCDECGYCWKVYQTPCGC